MFRITTQAADDELVMKLEGCLTGPWVRELDICWRDLVTSSGDHRVRLDLTAVWHVDEAGRELLAAMHRAGVHFVTRGCVMPEVVREISESADAAGTITLSNAGSTPNERRAKSDARQEGSGSTADAQVADLGLTRS